jgi:uncharacterized membrane protein (DUF2068 family)
MEPKTEPIKKKAPTLYLIIAIKLLKGLLFAGLALAAYTLSDNDLPAEYHSLLHHLRLNPERKFWADLAVRIGQLQERQVLVTAVGTLIYSLFSLVEGIGLMFRIRWAGFLAIGESAFFIPIEIFDLIHRPKFSFIVFAILCVNILIVWYLYKNRDRLFKHHT